MKEINRMCNIAKIVFKDNLVTLALENDLNSKYYITSIILKEKNNDQLEKFIADCDELISKPVTFRLFLNNNISEENFKNILISNN